MMADVVPASQAEWPPLRTGAFLVVLAVCCVAEISARVLGPHTAASANFLNGNSFVAYSLMAAFALHMLCFADWRERIWLAASGAGLCGAALLGYRPDMPWESVVGLALTLASLFTHAVQVVSLRRSVTRATQMLMREWLVPLATSVPSFYLAIAATLDTRFPLDDYLYRFEEGLGIRLGVLAYRAYFAVSGLSEVAGMLYLATPGVLLLQSALDREKAPDLAVLFVVSSALGYIAYQFYPAVGPHAFFLNYYADLWSGQALTRADPAAIMGAPRNTLPSLHAVWVAFIVLNAFRLPVVWRWLFLAAAALILMTTLASGHWFVDIVPSLPFAVALQTLCYGRGKDRLIGCAASAALMVGWMVALKTNWFVSEMPGALRWAAMGGTLIVSAWLARGSGVWSSQMEEPQIPSTKALPSLVL